MKKLILIIVHPFRKRKNTFAILFSEAMAEGIRDTQKEMGYFLNSEKQDRQRHQKMITSKT